MELMFWKPDAEIELSDPKKKWKKERKNGEENGDFYRMYIMRSNFMFSSFRTEAKRDSEIKPSKDTIT